MAQDILSRSTRHFISISSEQTLLDALQLIQQQDADDTWYLVVMVPQGGFLLGKLGDLREVVKMRGQTALSAKLATLGAPLYPVWGLDHETPPDDVEKYAATSPASAAVLTWGGDAVIGVYLVGGQSVEGAAPARPPRSPVPPPEMVIRPPEETPEPAPPAPRDVTTPAPIRIDKDALRKQATERDKPETNLSIAGDVAGDVAIAGDDVFIDNRVTNITEVEDTFESGPAWLRRTAEWVQGNVVLSALGFLIFVLLPFAWFVFAELVPALSPSQMTGEWNVAVGGFVVVGDERVTAQEARAVSDTFYRRFGAELPELGEEIDVFVEVWGPQETGSIRGRTPEDRAESAEARARQIGASIIIYGTVERVDGVLRIVPEFFINSENFYEAAELSGSHAYGRPIRVQGQGADPLSANRELSRRVQSLSLLTQGLVAWYNTDYDEAYRLIRRANDDTLWLSDQGREIIWLYEGNTANKTRRPDAAETAYMEALAINDDYARAWVGLGSVYLERGINFSDPLNPDEALIQQALDTFDVALAAAEQPPTADIPVKVAFGRGRAYLSLWMGGQAEAETLAVGEFERVIDEYEKDQNPRLAELAGESYGYLALISVLIEDYPRAIDRYLQAAEISVDPSRKAVFHAQLATLYRQQGDQPKSDEQRELAADQYDLARRKTTRPQQIALLWAQEADLYVALDMRQEAARAVRQAIRALPDDAPERAEYEARLAELEEAS